MGYNTTVNILNDCMEQIRRNPSEFVEGIMDNYYDGGTIAVGNCVNPATIMRTRHADELCLYVVHHNSIIRLNAYEPRTKEIATRLPELIRGYIEAARDELDRLERELDSPQSV